MFIIYKCLLWTFSGDYTQNQCTSSFNCQPCPDRLPSCVGLPDGANGVPRHQWASDYVICLKNRTMNISRCSSPQIFDPISRKCVQFVEPGMSCSFQDEFSLKWMGIWWNIINTRNSYVDHIWFHIKLLITKELSRDIVCIYSCYQL